MHDGMYLLGSDHRMYTRFGDELLDAWIALYTGQLLFTKLSDTTTKWLGLSRTKLNKPVFTVYSQLNCALQRCYCCCSDCSSVCCHREQSWSLFDCMLIQLSPELSLKRTTDDCSLPRARRGLNIAQCTSALSPLPHSLSLHAVNM